MSDSIPCCVNTTSIGWWLTFPAYPQAGLLLYTPQERADFAQACGEISLADPSYLEGVEPTEIALCPIEYLDKACNFTEEPF